MTTTVASTSSPETSRAHPTPAGAMESISSNWPEHIPTVSCRTPCPCCRTELQPWRLCSVRHLAMTCTTVPQKRVPCQLPLAVNALQRREMRTASNSLHLCWCASCTRCGGHTPCTELHHSARFGYRRRSLRKGCAYSQKHGALQKSSPSRGVASTHVHKCTSQLEHRPSNAQRPHLPPSR